MDTPPATSGPAVEPDASAAAPAPPAARARGLAPAGDQDRTGLWVVMVAGFVLRFWNLGAQSLWTDEGSAWTAASLPLRDLLDFCLHRDASPPLYYLLVKLALVAGEGEAALRAVSAIASSLLVWVTYRFARLAGDRRTATLAAALVAFAPFQLLYAQEARTYALVALWVVAGQLLFARAILLDRPRAFAPWVAVSALGLYTQSIAVLGMFVQGLFTAGTASGRRRFGRFALGAGLAGACYLPWFVAGLSGTHLDNTHWYVPPPSAHNVVQMLRAVFVSPIPLVSPPEPSTIPGLEAILPRPLAWLLLLGPTLAALGFSLPRLRDPGPRGTVARLAAAAVVIPLVVVFVVSLQRSLWLPRYFVFTGPPVALLLAFGVASIPRRALSMALAALLLAVAAYASFRVSIEYTKERWRDVAKQIAARSDPANTAVIVTFDSNAFEYYNRRFARPYRVFAAAHPDVPFHDRYTREQLGAIYRALRDSTQGFADVWVVVRSPSSPVRKQVAHFADQAAGQHRMPVLRDTLRSVQGPLRITRWVDRPDGAQRRYEMKAAEAWADSVIAAGPPKRDPITRAFTKAELAVNRDTLALYVAKLPDRSFFSLTSDGNTLWIAAERLGQLGPGVIPALMARVDAPDGHERMLVHDALRGASHDESILARTGGEYVNLDGALEGANHDRNAEIARAWWAKHRRFWDDAK